MILIYTLNLNSLLKYVSEPEAIMFFGVSLVVATIIIRWFLKRYEETESKSKK